MREHSTEKQYLETVNDQEKKTLNDLLILLTDE